jgi:aspartate dehydrogenase
VGLIGAGSIGKTVIACACAGGYAVSAVLVRPGRADAAAALAPDAFVTDDFRAFLERGVDVVVEAAGQEAVRELAEPVIAAGLTIYVVASGALADDGFRTRLATAASGDARVLVPSGAIAGIDGLLALRESGLSDVRYTSSKPPESWRGTPAADEFDLGSLEGRTTIFEGSARVAAESYPANANLAATIALAGIGFEATRVELRADATLAGNVGRLVARGAAGTLEVEAAGPASAENAKTSAVTGYSVAAALRTRSYALDLAQCVSALSDRT